MKSYYIQLFGIIKVKGTSPAVDVPGSDSSNLIRLFMLLHREENGSIRKASKCLFYTHL